eukprot:scaffold78141_cov30-Attheya_sp.AAC.2
MSRVLSRTKASESSDSLSSSTLSKTNSSPEAAVKEGTLESVLEEEALAPEAAVKEGTLAITDEVVVEEAMAAPAATASTEAAE